jgi:hypothetical protein
MVRASLVESDIRDGQRLVSALRDSDTRFAVPHFLLKAAFWLLDKDAIEWRLVIATPLVDQRGPFSAYTDIQGVLRRLMPISLTMQDISVVSPNHKLVKVIKKAGKVPSGSSGLRLGRARIDDTYVEDAYVYALMNKAA